MFRGDFLCCLTLLLHSLGNGRRNLVHMLEYGRGNFTDCDNRTVGLILNRLNLLGDLVGCLAGLLGKPLSLRPPQRQSPCQPRLREQLRSWR